jgi:hypothetical protein
MMQDWRERYLKIVHHLVQLKGREQKRTEGRAWAEIGKYSKACMRPPSVLMVGEPRASSIVRRQSNTYSSLSTLHRKFPLMSR